MRLKISKCKNVNIFYVIKTIYVDGKEKTKTVERLGTEEQVREKANGEDPIIWAKKYIDNLNKSEQKVLIPKSPSSLIEKNKQNCFNCGYLFLEKIYYELGLDKICNKIYNKYKITFDLNSVLSRLVYSRIVYPSSKLATYELSKKFLEQPNFELQHIYLSLIHI